MTTEERLAMVFEVSEARMDLLRYLVEGKACETPDRYGRDCGLCLRCICHYRDGAMRWKHGKAVLK